jgi:hypothetical protein
MSQYDLTIVYIPGEDNTVADTVSQVPDGAFPGKIIEPRDRHYPPAAVNTILSITTNPSILQTIHAGYKEDDFCKKIIALPSSTPGVTSANSLWYIGDHLLIPCFGTIWEDLFHLAHDSARHFSADKPYAMHTTGPI